MNDKIKVIFQVGKPYIPFANLRIYDFGSTNKNLFFQTGLDYITRPGSAFYGTSLSSI